MLFGGFGTEVKRKDPRPRNKNHSIKFTKGDRLKRVPFSYQTVSTYTAKLVNKNEKVIAYGDAKDTEDEALESLVYRNPDLFTIEN